MKHLPACLSAREDREGSFHHGRGPMRLMQACSSARKTSIRSFNLRGGAVKHLHACLSARRWRKQFSPLWRTFEVGGSLFVCRKDLITPF